MLCETFESILSFNKKNLVRVYLLTCTTILSELHTIISQGSLVKSCTSMLLISHTKSSCVWNRDKTKNQRINKFSVILDHPSVKYCKVLDCKEGSFR